MATWLEMMRETSQVDCDTMDLSVAEDLGPFVDCTSNQAIAFFELARLNADTATPYHASLIEESVSAAKGPLNALQSNLSLEEFIVEILMVKLQLRFLSKTTGFLHVQTNPKLSYSPKGTITNAHRIMAIFAKLAPDVDLKGRVCIKIPATWEGLQACRVLEAEGIATLATTMFCMEQATLAADAGCTYIAPYVNELKVHFEAGYVDENKAFDFCREAQSYYITHNFKTKVLAASLTSVTEVMQLSGIQHITISPPLLRQLAELGPEKLAGRLGDYFLQGPNERSWETKDYAKLFGDENAWRLAFTRSGFGTSEGKIIQAINYFSDFQEKLEELVRGHLV